MCWLVLPTNPSGATDAIPEVPGFEPYEVTTFRVDGDYTDRGYFYRFDDVEGSDVCPTGWHVPSASEWKTAITAVIGTGKNPTDFLIAASITYDGYAYGSPTTYWFDATHGSSGNDDAVSFWMSDGKAAYFENSGKTYDIGGTSVYDNDRSLVRCVTDES